MNFQTKKLSNIAILKGEVTFKVTFKKQHFPLGAWVGAAILSTCAKQIHAHATLSSPKPEKMLNFKVEVVEKKIELDKK